VKIVLVIPFLFNFSFSEFPCVVLLRMLASPIYIETRSLLSPWPAGCS